MDVIASPANTSNGDGAGQPPEQPSPLPTTQANYVLC
jgi:hypothetical protein